MFVVLYSVYLNVLITLNEEQKRTSLWVYRDFHMTEGTSYILQTLLTNQYMPLFVLCLSRQWFPEVPPAQTPVLNGSSEGVAPVQPNNINNNQGNIQDAGGYQGNVYPGNGYNANVTNGTGYPGNRYSSNGYSSNGYSGNGYHSNGYNGNEHNGNGFSARRRMLPPTPLGKTNYSIIFLHCVQLQRAQLTLFVFSCICQAESPTLTSSVWEGRPVMRICPFQALTIKTPHPAGHKHRYTSPTSFRDHSHVLCLLVDYPLTSGSRRTLNIIVNND